MPVWLYSRIFGAPLTVTIRWRNDRKVVDKIKAMRDALLGSQSISRHQVSKWLVRE